MTDKEELKKAIYTLKDYCIVNTCGSCIFEDCCMNRWSDYDTLEKCMGGLLEDMRIVEKVKNTDFGAAYDAVHDLVCKNFEDCKGCPFYNREDDCPLGQLDSVMVNY